MKPAISVIINTKNEENNIRNCLQSLADQSYPLENLEIIVVDNNSTDKTRKIIEKFKGGNALLDLKIFNQGPERSVQKNFGVRQSRGEYFIHLDADMTLGREVIAECANKIAKNSRIVALYIPEIVLGNRFFSRVRRFERSFCNGTVIDGLRFIKKNEFIKAGGFDENLYACEDWDLDKRLKKLGETDITKAVLYHNERQFNVRRYLKKKSYYSGNFSAYVKKWGKDDPDIKRQFGFYYRFLGIFIEKGKWKKLLAHPVLAFGMYWLRFLVGAIYFKKCHRERNIVRRSNPRD